MLYLVFFILLLLIIITLFLKVNVLIEYLRNDWDDHVVLSIYALKGILKYKYEISLLDIGKKGVKFSMVKEAGSEEKDIGQKDEKKDFIKLFDEFNHLKKLYKENKILIRRINEYMGCRITLKDLKLDIDVGTGEACFTGIIGGLLWSIIGILDSYISSKLKVESKSVDIKTDFIKKKLNIDLYCIFNVRIVHIIVVTVKILKYYLINKIKDTFKKKKRYCGNSKRSTHSV
jgi:hypothetical protein